MFFLQKVLLSTASQTFLTTDFAIIKKQCTALLIAKAAGDASEALIYRVRDVDFHQDSFASSPFLFLINPCLHYALNGDSSTCFADKF